MPALIMPLNAEPDPPIIDDLGRLLTWMSQTAGPFVLRLCLILGIACLLLRAGVGVARRIRVGRAWRQARFLEVIVPPDRADGERTRRFWTEVATALRSRRPRPHRQLMFELVIAGDRIRFGFRVPPGVNPSRIAHAARSAWPGAITQVTEPPQVTGEAEVIRRLTPADPEPAPQATGTPSSRITDQQTYTKAGQTHVLRIAVTPATARQVATVGASRPQRAQTFLGVISEFCHAVWHGPDTSRTGRPTPGPPSRSPVHPHTGVLADRPVWIAAVQVGSAALGPGADRRTREGVAELTGAFSQFRAGTGMRSGRRIGTLTSLPSATGGFVLTTTELAAIAGPPARQDDSERTTAALLSPDERVLRGP